MNTLDEFEAIRTADEVRGTRAPTLTTVAQALPPSVDLTSEVEVSTQVPLVTVRFRIRTAADAPVTSVRSRVNGLASDRRGLSPVFVADEEQTMTVEVPPRDSEIALVAQNRNGSSVPAVVHVRWTGSSETFAIQPKLYVLAIGVGAYRNPGVPKLGLAAKDAQDFAKTMGLQRGRLYGDVSVRVLADDQASKEAIEDGLDWLTKQVTQHDVGMLFLSGHGTNDPNLGYVYLPVDADPDRLKATSVTMNDIKDTMANLTGKAVFFLDTCHSGNVLGPGRKGLNDDVTSVVNELSSTDNGVVVFSSSTARQYSLESPEWGNGAFTKALVEGLSGQADLGGTGRITFKMLDLYVSERVKALTDGRQSPVTQAPGGVADFPLALR